MHPRARNRLVAVEERLALPEGIEDDSHGTHVQRMRTDPHQVVQDAGDLVEHHADVAGADGGLDAQHLLDGQHVGVLVAHHGHVVETVHVGQRLQVGALLGQLLGGPVQQADVRVGTLHDLAVHFQHQAQHAVGRRVLRPEVQGVVLDLGHVRLTARCAWYRLRTGLRGRRAARSRAARW